MASGHKWTFFRAGGFDQVKLESGADLMHLDQLDQTLWVALACPITGLEIDPRTLSLIDTDGNGRVRAGELIAAVRFAGSNLKNPDDLLKGGASLPLSAINDSVPEGRTLLASARQILGNIGKAGAAAIDVDDVSDRARIFADTPFNGDGVITELSGADENAKTLIREILDCVGGVQDLSGRMGIDAERVETFFLEARAFQEWQASGAADPGRIFPLGRDATASAAEATAAVKTKVDDYFGRCRLAAFDARAEKILNRSEEDYLVAAARDLTLTASELAPFPLALAAANRPLPLDAKLNPAHAEAMARFVAAAVTPLLGTKEKLAESEWLALCAKLAPFQAWQAEKAGAKVEKLGAARIEAILASDLRAVIEGLIARDRALEAETASIEKVEQLVRYHRDIALLCTNFVNFKDFYDRNRPSIFQCGTLYLDQRACRLCLRVEDGTKHSVMAGLAGAYLAYLDCARKGSTDKLQIVAAFTAGDSDNLMVGRNGVFYDRKGQDWDATIVKIVDNPISLSQAFWSPYKKFVRYLEEQVSKRAAAAAAETDGNLSATAAAAVHADKGKPPLPKKLDVGTVAAIGVAAGAIGTFVTALIGYATGVLKLGILPTLGALLGLILLISLPSVVMAYIKLRKRNLGPILDANGWAVNARARINVPFGATLSSVAKLPPGARRDFGDPYAEKGWPWKRALFCVIVLYVAFRWYSGSFDRILPTSLHPSTLLGNWAPQVEPKP